MDRKHRDILIKCRVALVKDLVPNDLFPHLVQERVLTSNDQERLEVITTRQERADRLLTTLPTKGPNAYKEFLNALEIHQPFLACVLLREGR